MRGSLNCFPDFLSHNVKPVPENTVGDVVIINANESHHTVNNIQNASGIYMVNDSDVPRRRSPRLAAKQSSSQPPNADQSHLPDLRRSARLANKNRVSQPHKLEPTTLENRKPNTKAKISVNKNIKALGMPNAGSESMNKMGNTPVNISPDLLTEMFRNQTLNLSQIHNDPKTHVSQQGKLESVDMQNLDVIADRQKFTSSHDSLFKKAKLKFSDKYHGSVPRDIRKTIKQLVQSNFTDDIDLASVIAGQQADPYYAPFVCYLKHQVLPSKKQVAKRILAFEGRFVLIDGCLFCLPKPEVVLGPAGEDIRKMKLQMVIPDGLVDTILVLYHDMFSGTGHAGFIRSFYSISNKFYIHNLANRLKNRIKSCGLCMRFGQVNKSQPRLPLTPTAGATVTQPFEHWQIDHFSYPQPVNNTISTANDMRISTVLTCEFTKYVYLFLVRSTGTDEVIQALRSITRVHGPFIRIQSDPGSAFTSEIMSKYTKITGTKMGV